MMKKKILTFLLVLFLMNSIVPQVSAAHPVPDLSGNGSITFEMVRNGVPLHGGSLKLCKVANIQEDDGNYSFALIDELKGSGVDMSTPTNPDVAQKLLNLVKQQQFLIIRLAPIVNGRALFSDLPVGLYLVWQDNENATNGFSPINPFLISIPKLEGDQYIYNIVAKPKVPLEPKPSAPPPPPPPPPPPSPPPYLPQTGQLNWPVPVMAVLGCTLFVLGLFLYSGRKGTDDEA